MKPLIYYVDNGAPEPIRTALIEGASWWNQAFEAAGFRNAFQVKVLPADAGLQPLTKLKGLSELGLNSTMVTDAGEKLIKILKHYAVFHASQIVPAWNTDVIGDELVGTQVFQGVPLIFERNELFHAAAPA